MSLLCDPNKLRIIETMQSANSDGLSALNRYSAKKFAKPVNFMCFTPNATEVFLAGDFNEWNPTAQPLTRQMDGAWTGQVSLSHGHHRYWFIVDGTVTLDPRAQGVGRNEKNERVSLIAVS